MTSVQSARAGAVAGAAALAACALWTAGTLSHLEGATAAASLETLRTGLEALWIAQALAVALLTPRVLAASPRAAAQGIATLWSVALPLPALAWLGGAVSAGGLVRSGVGLVGLGIALAAAGRGLTSRVSDPGARSGILAALELCSAAALWASRSIWLGWIG